MRVIEDQYHNPLDLNGAVKVTFEFSDHPTVTLIEVRPHGEAPYLLSTVGLHQEVIVAIEIYTALTIKVL